MLMDKAAWKECGFFTLVCLAVFLGATVLGMVLGGCGSPRRVEKTRSSLAWVVKVVGCLVAAPPPIAALEPDAGVSTDGGLP